MSTIEHGEWKSATSHGLSVKTAQTVRRLFEQVYSEGDLAVARESVGSDFEGYCTGAGKTYHGVGGVKAHASRLRAAFAGLTVEVDEISPTPEGFEARVTASGRFERGFGGIEPSCVIGTAGEEPHGPTVTFTGVATGRITDGTLRDWTIEWDTDALRNQA